MKHFGQIFPRLILFIVVIILSASAINAQDRDQEGLNGTVGGLLKASDYKYQKTAEFVWKLEHDGETIMVGAAGNLFRASIFIVEKKNFQPTVESLTELLKLSNQISFAKVGINNNGTVMVTVERKGTTLSKEELDDSIAGLLSAVKKVREGIKPFLIKTPSTR